MKKILAFLLAALMLVALFVVPASAAPTINDELEAELIKTAPKQDGKIGSSEYGLFPALTYSKDKSRFSASDDHDDYNDWDFDFYIAWDEKNLYMAWDVKSKVHQPMKKATYDDACNIISEDWPEDGSMLGHMWWQSCIQLIITPGAPKNGSTNYDANYLEVGFCQLDDGDVGRVAWAYPQGVSADKISLNDWSAEVARTGDHTIYEIAIPWTMSGIKKAGTDEQFGLTFAVAAQEDYNKVKKGMIEWNDAILGGKAPNKAGVITLKSEEEVIVDLPDEPTLEDGEVPAEAEGKVKIYIDNINKQLDAEQTALQTDGESEINTNWAYALLLRPVEGKENVYSIIAKAQGEGTGDVKFDDYKKGDLILGLHSDCQDPAKGADYAGYEEKNAAVNILAEGDELTLFGVDVKKGEALYSNAMFYCVAKDAAVSEPTDDSSDASIEESSIEESSEDESEEEKTSAPAAESSEADDDEGGFPVWAIILIIVAVVAVIAVVVVIVLKKKK